MILKRTFTFWRKTFQMDFVPLVSSSGFAKALLGTAIGYERDVAVPASKRQFASWKSSNLL